MDARSGAWDAGSDSQGVFDAIANGALEAGADLKTATCIAFNGGTSTGAGTCQIAQWVGDWASAQGASDEDAMNWTMEAASTKYDWISDLTITCPDFKIVQEDPVDNGEET